MKHILCLPMVLRILEQLITKNVQMHTNLSPRLNINK